MDISKTSDADRTSGAETGAEGASIISQLVSRLDSQMVLLESLAERDRQFFETVNAKIEGHGANQTQLLSGILQSLAAQRHLVELMLPENRRDGQRELVESLAERDRQFFETISARIEGHGANQTQILSGILQSLGAQGDQLKHLSSANRKDGSSAQMKSLAERDRQFFESIHAKIDGHGANHTQLLNGILQSLGAQHDSLGLILDKLPQAIHLSALAIRGDAGRARLRSACESGHSFTPPEIRPVGPIDEQLARLRLQAPAAFDLWIECFKAGVSAYAANGADSLSVSGNRVAASFGSLVAAQGSGALLDVGCGPQRRPSYLLDYPVDWLTGIDPISTKDDHDFRFFQAIGEELPFDDGAFETVVSGTSLDHALLLDRTFSEIRRVLADNGRFVVWIGTVPSAAAYDPYSPDVSQIDAYHLFHFSEATFEAAITPYFTVVEKMSVESGHCFYTLTKA